MRIGISYSAQTIRPLSGKRRQPAGNFPCNREFKGAPLRSPPSSALDAGAGQSLGIPRLVPRTSDAPVSTAKVSEAFRRHLGGRSPALETGTVSLLGAKLQGSSSGSPPCPMRAARIPRQIRHPAHLVERNSLPLEQGIDQIT